MVMEWTIFIFVVRYIYLYVYFNGSLRQLCGSYGENKYTYHDVNGASVIDTTLFPDFKAMTTYAHNLGLTAGYVTDFRLYFLTSL